MLIFSFLLTLKERKIKKITLFGSDEILALGGDYDKHKKAEILDTKNVKWSIIDPYPFA